MRRRKKSLGHKIYFTLLLLIFLFSCATSEKYDAELSGWVGKPAHTLIAQWGRPSARKINADGSEVITYTKADNVYVPSEFYLYNPYSLHGDVSVYAPFDGDYAFTPYGGTPGQDPELVCQTSFLVQNNIITGWKWTGNNCVAR